MDYPTKTSYAWVSKFKAKPFWWFLLALFSTYVFINCLFADAYYFGRVLKSGSTLLDYFYFSFVTALTIGYGDFYPLTPLGKVLVIVHSCFTAIYFAIMVAVLSAKMFYPRNTLSFSNNLLFNPQNGFWGVRMINTHRERLVNPEIRIFMTEHCFGNVISRTHRVTKADDMPYLGKHDFSLYFPDYIEIDSKQTLSIFGEWEKALAHNRNDSNKAKSRFNITVSVSGSYGLQQIAYYKKYYPSEIEIGVGFKAIEYNEEDQRTRGNIRYTKFPNFWNDFNKILKDDST